MKIKFTLNFITLLMFTLLLAQPSLAAVNIIKPKEEVPAKKGKHYSSRNNQAVKIYPSLWKRTWHVVAKETNTAPIEFFVFDLEGTLVQHYKMIAGQHEKLKLERGKYQFRAFVGDEETANGLLNAR